MTGGAVLGLLRCWASIMDGGPALDRPRSGLGDGTGRRMASHAALNRFRGARLRVGSVLGQHHPTCHTTLFRR